jgi:hypothetical protein
MSDPAIYIELQGTTRYVRPRYTPPGSARPRPAPAPAIRGYMVRYSGFPIRHTEFGIRKSKIGNRGTGNLHGAVFSLLTTMEMVR